MTSKTASGPALRLGSLFAALLVAGCGGGEIARTKTAELPKTLRGGNDIEGVIFLDVNANGWRDQSEPSIPELPITLDGTVRAITDSCGQFAFSGLAPGFHRISMEQSEMPAVYAGAPKLSQNIRAGKETSRARFEVGMVPPKLVPSERQVIVREMVVAPPLTKAATEAEKQKALVAIKEVTQRLERLKASGYVVLVKDTVSRIEGALADAKQLIEIGDPVSAVRLAGLAATAVDEARKRIETETQQPMRW